MLTGGVNWVALDYTITVVIVYDAARGKYGEKKRARENGVALMCIWRHAQTLGFPRNAQVLSSIKRHQERPALSHGSLSCTVPRFSMKYCLIKRIHCMW